MFDGFGIFNEIHCFLNSSFIIDFPRKISIEKLLERVFLQYLDHDISMEQMYVENQWYFLAIHRSNTLKNPLEFRSRFRKMRRKNLCRRVMMDLTQFEILFDSDRE